VAATHDTELPHDLIVDRRAFGAGPTAAAIRSSSSLA